MNQQAGSPEAASPNGKPRRVIAIDWSGHATSARKKMWLAEVLDGTLVRLENGRDRAEIAVYLRELARRDPHVVVGLDFAFSLPAWFLRSRGLARTADLWALADREAERWLASCQHPFWGRPGVGKPADIPEHFRHTDADVPSIGGIRPKSVFQICGAGAVGTGSLRGMSLVHALHRAGFAIWPFDAPGWPLVVEIYPRALTGAVVKSDPAARARFLAAQYPTLESRWLTKAELSEDAFDAAVSALVMARHASSFADLRPANDAVRALEGSIWLPPAEQAPGRAPVVGVTRDVTVATFVVRGDAVLLLRHRKLGLWLPPGGHVEPNELPDEAAVREVLEETGVHVRLLPEPSPNIPGPRRLARPEGIQLEPIAPGHEHIDLIYFAVPTGGTAVAADSAEVERAGWYRLRDLDALGVTQEVRDWAARAMATVRRRLEQGHRVIL